MKGQGVVLFLLGMAVGIGCGFGDSYLMQQMSKTDEAPATVTTETDKTADENKPDETSEATDAEPANATEGTATENNTQGEEQPTDGASSNALFSEYEWPEAEINGAIPQPNFGSKPTSVSTSSGYVAVDYSNVSTDDALAYIEELKNSGYTYKQHETKTDSMYSYDARNGEDVLTSAKIGISYRNTQEFGISWIAPIQ